jgi:deoxyribose-phosphate aldolase
VRRVDVVVARPHQQVRRVGPVQLRAQLAAHAGRRRPEVVPPGHRHGRVGHPQAEPRAAAGLTHLRGAPRVVGGAAQAQREVVDAVPGVAQRHQRDGGAQQLVVRVWGDVQDPHARAPRRLPLRSAATTGGGEDAVTERTGDLRGRRYAEVAGAIDHSVLRPELDAAAVSESLAVAVRYRPVSVCVRPADVALAAGTLAGLPIAVGTVVSFPHGDSRTETKVAEAERAMADGATELDMVLRIGALRGGEDDVVLRDIAAVVDAAAGRAIVKVILENAYLDDEQTARGCRLAEQAGAHYVKTSTGFAPGGATLADVRLMRESVSPAVGVKAAGGVRTLDALLDMLDAGATRIGATATAAILDEVTRRGG